jgi:Tol biopolymer transport system component/DNA-binding winged helix-turn-helix (wHTH) protein
VYVTGDLRVDARRARLFRGDEVVPLEPKVFDVLCYLVEHRDRLVTKEELLDTIWANTFVTPNALTRTVAQLRKSLDDDPHNARYIETVARRGYRFIAPVEVVTDTAEGNGDVSPSDRPTRPSARLVLLAAFAVAALLAIAGVIVMSGRRPAVEEQQASTAASNVKLDRVTTRGGYNGWPSISPDGSRVAYVSDQSGSLEIHVIGLTAGSRDLAITRDGGQNIQPAWSPDGQWIAYHSRRRDGIWVVPSTGGTPVQISDFGSQPSWSPDSSTLVFTSGFADSVLQASLWTVRRDGSDRKQLTESGRPQGSHRNPVWAHNGAWILFSVYEGGVGRGSLSAIDVRSGEITTVAGDASYIGTVTRDDREVIFRHAFGPEPLRLRRVAVDPLTGKPRGTPTVVREIHGPTEGMSAAADGSLVLGIGEAESNLWAVDFNGRGEPVRLTDSAVRVTRPKYSRSGKIAYIEAQQGQPRTWLMSSDRTSREPIVADRATTHPMWSPDGDRVLVRHDDAGGRHALSWVDLATRRMTPTALRGELFDSPALSPGGDEVAYHTFGPGGVLNVWTQKLDGSAKRQVTFDAEGASYAAWSPEGRQLAVELVRGNSVQIGVVSRDGGAIRMLTSGRGQSWPHSWSPDGRWIAFAGQRDGVWNIYAVEVQTSEVRQLTRFTSADTYVRYPEWSPDGSHIVFERGRLTSGIWKMSPGQKVGSASGSDPHSN